MKSLGEKKLRKMHEAMSDIRDEILDYSRKYKVYVLVCFLLGVIMYFPIITQPLTNADGITISLTHKSSHEWENSLGRFGLQYVDRMRGNYIFPELTTFFCLFLLACIAVLIIEIFQISSKATRAAVGVILILSPSVANTLTYYYCSDSYMLAYLLAVLSAFFLLNKTRPASWGLAIISIATSLMLYQAYIGVTITICLFWTIQHCLDTSEEKKKLYRTIGRALSAGLLGVILYLGLFKLNQLITGVAAADNRGFNEMGHLSLKELPVLIKRACIVALQYFFSDDLINNSWMHRKWLNVLIVGVTGAVIIYLFFNKKRVKDKGRILIAIVGILCIPVSLGCMVILAPEVDIYGATSLLMLPQMSIAYIFAISMYKYLAANRIWFKALLIAGALGVLFLLGTSAVYTSAFQTRLKENLNKTYYVASEIVHQMCSMDNYDASRKVMIGGKMESGNYPDLDNQLAWAMEGTVANYGLIWPSPSASQGCWHGVFNQFLGVNYTMCSVEEYNRISQMDEYKEMGNFPEEDSIKVIEGITVVKLSS